MGSSYAIKKINFGTGVFCYLVEIKKTAEFRNSNEILNKQETKIAQYLSGRRKTEWICGRIAAKSAVCKALSASGFELNLNEIVINSGNDRKPEYRAKIKSPKMHISISHCKNAAVAVCSGMPVGIDIETPRKFSASLLSRAISPDDCIGISKRKKDIYYTSIWCVKEAASKAMGLGMKLDFRKIKVGNKKNGSFVVAEWKKRRLVFDAKIKMLKNNIIALCVLKNEK